MKKDVNVQKYIFPSQILIPLPSYPVHLLHYLCSCALADAVSLLQHNSKQFMISLIIPVRFKHTLLYKPPYYNIMQPDN